MGYRSDLGTSTVSGIHEATGWPMDEWGHLLDPNFDGYTPWDVGTELYNLTSPYGHLHFACGTGDDFHCFDYATISGARGEWIILDGVINSETGGFIMGSEYHVLPINTKQEKIYAVREAFGMCAQAEEWCMWNDLQHHRKGWNQTPSYFARAVFCDLFSFELRMLSKKDRFSGRLTWVTDRMKRMGSRTIDHLYLKLRGELA